MRFSTRVFLLTFTATVLLLLVGLWTLQALVALRVSEGLGESLRETHAFVGQLREAYELQSDALVTTVAENAALKAGFDLVAAEGASAAAQLTLEDQLVLAASELRFDLIGAIDADGEPIAGLIRSGDELRAFPFEELSQLRPGLVELGEDVYFVNTTAVTVAAEILGTLVVGREFSLSTFSAPVLLTRGASIVKSNLPQADRAGLELELASCEMRADCEVSLGGERFLVVSVGDVALGNGFALRSLQSVDAAGERIQEVVFGVFLVVGAVAIIGGLALSWFVARSAAKPLAKLARRMETRLGVDQASTAREHNTDELEEIAAACDGLLGQIEKREQNLEGEIELRTAQLNQTNAELVGAMEQALEGDRIKSEFLANMSHEIRTPLNVVLGMTELAAETATCDKQKQYLGMVQDSGESLLAIVNTVLDFSKVESGNVQLRPGECELRSVAHRVVSMLQLQADEKGLKLACDVDSALPATIVVDEGRLKQVLVNLVSNGIKFTAEGAVTIGVDAEGCSSDQIRFVVRDTGAGVPPDLHAAIFERFRQVDGSSTRSFGGAGLGLAISKRLVEAMGGSIWVESEVGKGSSFHFTIRAGMTEVLVDELAASVARPGEGL